MIYDTPLKDLIYDAPSNGDVPWENLSFYDFSVVRSYCDNDKSIYVQMNLEEQFMLLCFVILAEESK